MTVDPILSRSLLALTVGVALTLLGILLDRISGSPQAR